MNEAIVNLGSNVNRETNLSQALRSMRRHPRIHVVQVSTVYESPSSRDASDPQYLNASARVQTELDAASLKKACLAIEARLGRERTNLDARPIEVPIDIDITLVREGHDEHMHPELLKHAYLLMPAAELAPSWVVPSTGRTLRDELKAMQSATTMREHSTQLVQPVDRQTHFASDIDDSPGEVYDVEFELLVRQLLVRIGEDPEREGLLRTPLRVAKAMDFLTSGYEASLEEVINNAIFEEDHNDMVIVKDIEFYSMCEHHMLPFFGRAHVAYLPNKKIIGLSKIARIVDVFARRLQVQERLTQQVANALMEALDAHGVAVVTEASHFCMMMRGVQKQSSSTVTSAMRGVFLEDARTRAEFMDLLRLSR